MTPLWTPRSAASSDSSIRPIVARSRWPCSILTNRARFVFDHACSVSRFVVKRRFSIIVLMSSLSSATSPSASTWIERVRSPLVTAVATSASAHLCRQICGELIDVAGQILPGAGDTRHLCLTAEPALGADLMSNARHFAGKSIKLVNHPVDGLLQLQDLASDIDSNFL